MIEMKKINTMEMEVRDQGQMGNIEENDLQTLSSLCQRTLQKICVLNFFSFEKLY